MPTEAGSAPANLLHRFLPHELAAKLEAARATGAMDGERRVVTMLFCDMTGSTAAAEKLDPEEWTEIMNGAFERMIRPIYRYEGTVARLMGDAILAFFGAPIAHEDDPVRAVLAGLDIVTEFERYQEQVCSVYGLQILPRVGINTGKVVVGTVGTDLRMEYTAMGDAINLAARMEQTAEPGTVQVAEATYRSIAPMFEVVDLGEITVRGKADPVRAYRVLGRKAEPGRLRREKGFESPLVGRQSEMARLTAVMNRLQAGVGDLVCIVGEAGLGKSRLVRELKDRWQAPLSANHEQVGRTPAWFTAASYSYETVQPYALFQRVLRRMMGIEASEAAESVHQKVEQELSRMSLDEQERLSAVIFSLFGLETSLEGEAFKRELFASFPMLIRQRLAETPAVIVLDDIHWSDSVSIDLLLHLLPLTGELPLLILALMRTDPDAPSWQVREIAENQKREVIYLQPLSEDDSQSLVEELLMTTNLPQDLWLQILEKSAGNPFFVEEVVRALADHNLIGHDEHGTSSAGRSGGDIQIPDNIHSLLLARIDRLPESVKHTLQLAAIIGRYFSRRVLEQVIQLEYEQTDQSIQGIGPHLAILQEQQMIIETARIPERTFMFRHALTQEAAYKAILRRQRKTYHMRVGLVLEQLFAEELEDNAAALAFHYDAADDGQRAFRFSVMAGNRAYRMYALREALFHYDRAMKIARQTDTVDSGMRLDLCRLRGRTLELIDPPQSLLQALLHYQEMQAMAADSDDRPLTLASMIAQATIYNTPSPVRDAVKGEQIAQEAQQLARELGDWQAAAELLWTLMLHETWVSDNPYQAIEYGETSLMLAREHVLERQLAYALVDLAAVYMAVGRSAAARTSLEEAHSRFEKLGDRPMLAQVYRTTGYLYYAQGHLQEATAQMNQALEIDRSIENRWGILAEIPVLGLFKYEQGHFGAAIEEMEWGLAEARDMELKPMLVYTTCMLAFVYLAVGAWPAAAEILDFVQDKPSLLDIYSSYVWSARTLIHLQQGDLEAARSAHKESQEGFDPRQPITGGVVYAPVAVRLADINLAMDEGEWAKALAKVNEMLKYLQRVELLVYRPEALYIRGLIWREMGKTQKAKKSWRQARRESEQIGERRMRWQILAGLAELAGDDAEGNALLKEANEMLTTLLQGIKQSEYQHAFRRRPEVQALLTTHR
ncbi:MAG: adenylate/guanylate cyclase domain-containing protein [Candidatus Promineifilaceae bacterium]|nr:adenylate/guanylate cyclase domain-containing protein [Candidatus Promineifilaceae bacterium]